MAFIQSIPVTALGGVISNANAMCSSSKALSVASTPLSKRAASSHHGGVHMNYDMDGEGEGTLGVRRIKSSGVENDRRSFKVTFVLPSESRLETFRELQNVYTTKIIPFSSWYAEQQRIQKMGGKIFKVELCAGGQMRSCGNS